MSHPCHRILLVESDTQLIDQIFELSEQVEAFRLQILKASDTAALDSLLEHYEFSLAVVNVQRLPPERSLNDLCIRFHPKPVLALVPDLDAAHLLSGLRAGASDIYSYRCLNYEAQAFVATLSRLLSRAAQLEAAHRYRESLERSLDELREDQMAAQQVQQNLLPAKLQSIGGVSFAYDLTPSLVLSGDFVDVAPLDDHLTLFYLADVSGHGASSALVTVLLKNMTNRVLRAHQRDTPLSELSPASTLYVLNRELLDTGLGKHFTIFAGILDARNSTLKYAVGGHHPMPVLNQGGEARFLTGRGMPVGLFDEPFFDEHELHLADTFSLTLFSDGVLEVMAKEGSLDKREERLRELVAAGVVMPDDLLESVLGSASCPDDIAILTLYRGALDA
ncbi:PP2C family protein-serine/threonine phosphatase [Marinobacterium rhizophilum]|uniref:SpoIIE family protein phosphatase n=1 Tax=Marinobacterium rhizophilum TaxID=420402 RepID=A0ABY5HND9_9GAMM|nr:SpoIIE family protein phosphatase [Marinobacterium rhizophilum]UTW13808.1 SpoIIE family protein phosphatase [Marinobacterium rhizophilum]